MARSVLARNLKVRKGESVLIESWTHGLPYVGAFVEESRRLGAEPMVLYEDERAWWSGVSARRTRPLGRMSRSERAALQAADVYVYFWGPEDRPRADALPDKVSGPAFAFNEEWYRVGRRNRLRGCRMSVAYATDPAAKALGLDGPRWRRRIATAGLADATRMSEVGERLVPRLRTGRELRLRHPNGTDLTLGLAGYVPRVEVGLVDRAAKARPYGFLANSPAGTVMVGLDESTAEGTIVSNTAYVMPGLRVGTGRWEFANGRLASLLWEQDGADVGRRYRSAGEGKDRPAFLSIGLNPKASRIPQYEEIESGMVVFGVGGNAFLGGKNPVAFQLYSLLRGADVLVDGEPIVRAGHVGAS